MDYLITLANFVFLSAYLVRDMLRLRLLSLLGTSLLVIYFATRPEPMLQVVGWNLFYVVLNAAWILRLVLRRRGSASARVSEADGLGA